MGALNNFFFIALPYMAIIIFSVVGYYRYSNMGFKYSSLSSQFLEGKSIFYGILPFHIGLIVVFIGHFIAFFLPQALLSWNSFPNRLLIFEGTGIIFGLSTLFGLIVLLVRRLTNDRIKAVSNTMDLLIEFMLFFQVIFGIWVAVSYRWGSSWFAADLSPYLWSIIKIQPDISAVIELPFMVQLHIVTAFAILLIFPFTRLIHLLVLPLHYINRPYQQVIWNYDHKTVRDNSTAWTVTRPKNN